MITELGRHIVKNVQKIQDTFKKKKHGPKPGKTEATLYSF